MALALLAQAAAALPPVQVVDRRSPAEIVAATRASDWMAIAPSDLLVMDLAPDAKGVARRVVIQMMPPPFSQQWIANIRKLAAVHWWDGTSINRVQDNYVVQWGDAEGENKAKAKRLPAGLQVVGLAAYSVDQIDIHLAHEHEPRTPENVARLREVLDEPRPAVSPDAGAIDLLATRDAAHPQGWHQRDSYAEWVELHGGWALSSVGEKADARFWPVHCYGAVGVGRDMPPDTGSGAELYAVIGHAPRHLDRNIAVVGRVIEGIEHLSSLPRGTGALGFYERSEQRVPIVSIRIGDQVFGLPRYQYLSTESASFAAYADARANRRDPFFIAPAGGADICNIPVPVRRVSD